MQQRQAQGVGADRGEQRVRLRHIAEMRVRRAVVETDRSIRQRARERLAARQLRELAGVVQRLGDHPLVERVLACVCAAHDLRCRQPARVFGVPRQLLVSLPGWDAERQPRPRLALAGDRHVARPPARRGSRCGARPRSPPGGSRRLGQSLRERGVGGILRGNSQHRGRPKAGAHLLADHDRQHPRHAGHGGERTSTPALGVRMVARHRHECRLCDRVGVGGEDGEEGAVERAGVKLDSVHPAQHRALGRERGLVPPVERFQIAFAIAHVGGDPQAPTAVRPLAAVDQPVLHQREEQPVCPAVLLGF